MPLDLNTICIAESSTIAEAMRSIEAGGVGIALIVDAQRRLLGTFTDGDLRRALIKGGRLDAPVGGYMHRQFTKVEPSAGRAEVLDLMQAQLMRQIPIVDESGRLIGLHLLHEVIGAVPRPNWAVIMAGGRGTRLGALTEHVPKPMITVAGRPILERLVLHLVSFGIRKIFLSINYLGHVIEAHFRDGAHLGCQIEYLREQQPLGTGGALALLPSAPEHPVVVLNGDLVTQANLDRMLAFHAHGAFQATMGVRRYVHEVPFGCVDVQDHRIVRLEEKPPLERLVNAGIYVIEPRILERVPAREFPITALFEDCLARRDAIGAFEITEDWIDVGQRDTLKRAREGGGD